MFTSQHLIIMQNVSNINHANFLNRFLIGLNEIMTRKETKITKQIRYLRRCS